MKRMLAVALMLATVGCIDVPAMNGLMDRLVPEQEAVYTQVELNRFEGQFAPDPDQDQDTLIDAALDIAEEPLQFQQALQNLSWVEYTHKFELPQDARYPSHHIARLLQSLLEPRQPLVKVGWQLHQPPVAAFRQHLHSEVPQGEFIWVHGRRNCRG